MLGTPISKSKPAASFRMVQIVERLLLEANPMAGVFQNIDPPTPSPPGECVLCSVYPPAFGHTRMKERGVGGQ